MNKHLQHKLKSYSLAASAIGAVSMNAEAQVTEYPLTVSVTTFGSNTDFDLNGDNIDDFKLEIRSWGPGSGAAYLTPLNGNSVLGTKLASSFQGLSYAPTELANGDTVDANQSVWVGSGSSVALAASYGSGGYGPFNNKSNALVGVAFDKGMSGTQYGWIRMSTTMTPTERSISISHLAVTDKIGDGIKAGTTVVTDIIDELNANTSITINDANQITVKSPGSIGNVALISLTGQEVQNSSLNDGQIIFQANAPAGIYVVRLATQQGVISRKVYLN